MELCLKIIKSSALYNQDFENIFNSVMHADNLSVIYMSLRPIDLFYSRFTSTPPNIFQLWMANVLLLCYSSFDNEYISLRPNLL